MSLTPKPRQVGFTIVAVAPPREIVLHRKPYMTAAAKIDEIHRWKINIDAPATCFFTITVRSRSGASK
jgi:hypothetical protein